MTIGERIVFLREERGISQKELASSLHITAATLSRYENDIYQPKVEFICEMCQILNTTSDFLLGFSMQYNPTSDDTSHNLPLLADEKKILTQYRKLSSENKIRASERIVTLLELQN